MSSEDDSDCINESETCNNIIKLLALRTQQNNGVRRLYDGISPANRRSLNVQKIFQKQVEESFKHQVHENQVVDHPVIQNQVVDDDSKKLENEISGTPMTTRSRQTKAFQKSIVCSTPMARNFHKKFMSSLSPVKNTFMQPTSKLDDELINTARQMQPVVMLNDVLNLRKANSSLPAQISGTKSSSLNSGSLVSKNKTILDSINQDILPKSPINRPNKSKLQLKNGRKENSKSQSDSSNFEIISGRFKHNKISANTNKISALIDKEILNSPTSNLGSNSKTNSESELDPNQDLEMTADTQDNQSCILTSNLISCDKTNVSNQNTELQNTSSKTIKHYSKTIKSALPSKPETNITTSVATQVLQDWSCSPSKADSLEVIPETQENHIEINFEKNDQTVSQQNQKDPTLSGMSIASSTTVDTQSIHNATENSKKKKQGKRKKKKISDSYINFLNLEKSAKRRSSSKLGSKRKLYSMQQDFEKLQKTINRDSDSDSTLQTVRSSNMTTSPKIQSPMVDSDGFKIPKLLTRTIKSPRKQIPDKSIGLITSEIGAVAENIRILNQSQFVQTQPNLPITPKKKKGKRVVRPKQNNTKDSVNNSNNLVEESLNSIRRSTRTRHEPMTFWKVHREPIKDDHAEFYKNMFLKTSGKSHPGSKPSSKSHPGSKTSSKSHPSSKMRKKLKSTLLEAVESIPQDSHQSISRNERETEIRSPSESQKRMQSPSVPEINSIILMRNKLKSTLPEAVESIPQDSHQSISCNERETETRSPSEPQKRMQPLSDPEINSIILTDSQKLGSKIMVHIPNAKNKKLTSNNNTLPSVLIKNAKSKTPAQIIQPTTLQRHTLDCATTKKGLTSDSAIQMSNSDEPSNGYIKFLKKFGMICTSDEEILQPASEISTQTANEDFLNLNHLMFQELSDTPGLEFAFVPNSNETFGFMKLQPGAHKPNSRTSRKFYLTLMLFTDSSIKIKVNENTLEMALGEMDSIQLPPDSRYELTNNSSKPAIIMSIRTSAKL